MNKLFKTSGFLPTLAAFAGNLIVTVIKFVGFVVSGSSAMFSESIHSLADTANQSLLLIGVQKSTKKADIDYNYGYGRERFVWALISACGIFFVGCGVTVYHGINVLLHPEDMSFHVIVFYILILAFIVESITFIIALKDAWKNSQEKTFLDIIKNGDPAILAVLYEDGIAVLGVLIALLGIGLSYLTGNHIFDPLSSILIGLLLGIMAILLISKNRNYLLTKSIPEDIREQVLEILNNEPTIEKVLDFKSSVVDINKYLIKCEVEFNASALIEHLEKHGFLKREYPLAAKDYNGFMKFCVEYMDRVPRMIGKEIDKIEKEIHTKIPQIIFIDIEIN